jgi:hypothetical protein
VISPRLYTIVPRTLYDKYGNNITMTCGRMAAQVAHLAGLLGKKGVDVAGTDLIILQVSNSSQLEYVESALVDSSVDFEQYLDTNKAYEGELLTALALYPIERGSCEVLRELKPWVCACNI